MAPRQVTISVLHRAISKPWRLFLQLCYFFILAARQPESRTVGRAPEYQILWVRGFRDHTNSGRGFNLSSRCGAISGRLRFAVRRDPSDRDASVQKIDDRLDDLRRDGGMRTNIERRRNFGKKFVERLGSYGRGVVGDALFAPPETRSQRVRESIGESSHAPTSGRRPRILHGMRSLQTSFRFGASRPPSRFERFRRRLERPPRRQQPGRDEADRNRGIE